MQIDMCVLWAYYLQSEVNENMTTIKTIIKPTGIGGVKESVPYANYAVNVLVNQQGKA